MGKAAAKLMQAQEGEKRQDRPQERPLSPHEKIALKKLRREAKAAGATLATGGKGGLDPSLVLGVMRRDRFKCKRCGGADVLSVHHKQHLDHPVGKWLKKKAKIKGQGRNDPSLIATVCEGCHTSIHNEDRERGA